MKREVKREREKEIERERERERGKTKEKQVGVAGRKMETGESGKRYHCCFQIVTHLS